MDEFDLPDSVDTLLISFCDNGSLKIALDDTIFLHLYVLNPDFRIEWISYQGPCKKKAVREEMAAFETATAYICHIKCRLLILDLWNLTNTRTLDDIDVGMFLNSLNCCQPDVVKIIASCRTILNACVQQMHVETDLQKLHVQWSVQALQSPEGMLRESGNFCCCPMSATICDNDKATLDAILELLRAVSLKALEIDFRCGALECSPEAILNYSHITLRKAKIACILAFFRYVTEDSPEERNFCVLFSKSKDTISDVTKFLKDSDAYKETDATSDMTEYRTGKLTIRITPSTNTIEVVHK